MTFVASSRPPSPTSTTAISTAARRNSSKAMAVAHSKKVGRRLERAVAPPAVRPPPGPSPPRLRGRAVVDLAFADDEPLLDPFEVRRGIARRAVPGRRGARPTHRRDRPFAVGAGDDDRAEGAFGMAERGADRLHVLEAELHPETFEREAGTRVATSGQGLAAAWRRALAARGLDGPARPVSAGERGALAGTPKRSTRAIMSFISRRSTIDVEHAVLEQELAALESFGQRLADRLLDDARTGKADERLRLGDVDVAQHGEARRDAAGRRIGEHRDVGQPRPIEPGQARR